MTPDAAAGGSAQIQSVADLMAQERVTSHKVTADGLVAVRKQGFWRYFRLDLRTGRYVLTGTTRRYDGA